MSKKYKEPTNPVGTVAELFAGVGGFRIGLARAGWKTVFSNQWEPSTKVQHASSVYKANFGADGHSSVDIANVEKIPCKFDLLVGGFPCQDYSVAKSLNSSKGLEGKKGVLWWEILRIVKIHKPKFILLENVDRLLKSPANQRGRDFAVMLRSLGELGYLIEWRVVNAAEYGFPQRRIRVFIVARIKSRSMKIESPYNFIIKDGILPQALPVTTEDLLCSEISLEQTLDQLSKSFNKQRSEKSPFLNSGVYFDGIAYSLKTIAKKTNRNAKTLGDVLQSEDLIDDSFFIANNQLAKWRNLKGAKKITRVHKRSGAKYNYTEGSMAFPDAISKPSRTILTGEGGSTPSRFKHLIKTQRGYRRLTPIELERLNGFPDDWTKFGANQEEIPATKRAFLMGNALVVGIVCEIGKVIAVELKKLQK